MSESTSSRLSSVKKSMQDQDRGRVRFCERVIVQRTLSIDEMTDREIDNMWFFQDDFDHMRRRERKLSSSSEEATPERQEILLNIYGVESLVQKRQSNQRVQEYAVSILIEQERQWEEDLIDPFLLASLSEHMTLDSRVAARTRGEHVAHHVSMMSSSLASDTENQKGQGSVLRKRYWAKGERLSPSRRTVQSRNIF